MIWNIVRYPDVYYNFCNHTPSLFFSLFLFWNPLQVDIVQFAQNTRYAKSSMCCMTLFSTCTSVASNHLLGYLHSEMQQVIHCFQLNFQIKVKEKFKYIEDGLAAWCSDTGWGHMISTKCSTLVGQNTESSQIWHTFVQVLNLKKNATIKQIYESIITMWITK